jgi:formylglycine-generating enzyme
MKRILFTVIAVTGILLLAGCPNGTIPTTYAVTVSPSGAASGESVSADVSEAAEGATVTLTASLNSGRQVALSASGVSISPATISSDGGTATFTMPAAAVEVTATFSDIPATTYAVTVSPSGAVSGESVSADVTEAAEGAIVTLTASLNSGRQVALSASGVTISPATISSDGGTATFTMPAAAVEVTATFSIAIGFKETVTAGSETLTMIYAQDQASISFPTETDDGTPATLTTKFWMAETEVTNAVMAEVLQWAYDNGRFSTTVSDANGLDTTTAKHGEQQLLDLDDVDCRVEYDGAGSFSAESGYEDNPVTNVTWYGAVMFCNWLTEVRDGNAGNVVYEWVDNGDGDDGIDSDGIWQDDETDENIALNGYRLPSADEWEYAARYLGTTAPATGGNLDTQRKYGNDDASWTDGYYWTPGNYASGAYTYYNDESDVNPSNGVVDNKDANDEVAVYRYYYAGSWQDKGTSDEAAVGSLGAGSANELGVYDMSGNVWEWCFTESGSYRFTRGGSWRVSANNLRVGYWGGSSPYFESDDLGFRPCRTAD